MVGTRHRYTYIAKGRYWRFRHPVVGDTALPGEPGSSEFHARYAELLSIAEQRVKAAKPNKTTLRWLIRQYQTSPEFRALADPTQTDYGRTLALLDKALGEYPYKLITTGMIRAVRNDHADTARKAHKVKQMASALYAWAGENDHVPPGHNPAAPIKRLKRQGGAKEYTVWSVYEFDTFIAGAIPPMRTAAMLARYTGQRVENVVRMTWGDYQGGAIIRVRTSKTNTALDLSCHKMLRDYLNRLRADAGDPAHDAPILMAATGKPYNANSLSSAVGREVKRVPGMPSGRSLHGLRYMAGADMEEAGCTIGQVEAVLGHHTFKMAMKYATQRLRSREAAAKREENEA